MSPMELGHEQRSAQAASVREEEARKSVSDQLMQASGRVPQKARTRLADDEFLWSHCSPRRRACREKSLSGPPRHSAGLVWKLAACNTMELGGQERFVAEYTRFGGTSPGWPCLIRSLSRPVGGARTLLVRGAQSARTVHASSAESGTPKSCLPRGDFRNLPSSSPDSQTSVQQPLCGAAVADQTRSGTQTSPPPSFESWRPLREQSSITGKRCLSDCMRGSTCFRFGARCDLMITESSSRDSCATLNSLSQGCSLGRKHTVPTKAFNESLSSWTRAVGWRSRIGVMSDSTSCKSQHRKSETTCCLHRGTTTQESVKQR